MQKPKSVGSKNILGLAIYILFIKILLFSRIIKIQTLEIFFGDGIDHDFGYCNFFLKTCRDFFFFIIFLNFEYYHLYLRLVQLLEVRKRMTYNSTLNKLNNISNKLNNYSKLNELLKVYVQRLIFNLLFNVQIFDNFKHQTKIQQVLTFHCLSIASVYITNARIISNCWFNCTFHSKQIYFTQTSKSNSLENQAFLETNFVPHFPSFYTQPLPHSLLVHSVISQIQVHSIYHQTPTERKVSKVYSFPSFDFFFHTPISHHDFKAILYTRIHTLLP